jgi:hypothetical protein
MRAITSRMSKPVFQSVGNDAVQLAGVVVGRLGLAVDAGLLDRRGLGQDVAAIAIACGSSSAG